MSDHTQIGVRVWRAYGMNSSWFRRPQDDRDAPYLAIPLDTESLAGLRERIAVVIGETLRDGDAPPLADVVLAALGLEQA